MEPSLIVLDRVLSEVMLEIEFRPYLDYIKFMEEFLEEEEKKEHKNFQGALSKLNPDSSEFLDFSPAKALEFAGMLRNSFFVSLYSFFENKLISQCRLRKTDSILLDFDDIRGLDVIERVKKYFTKVLRTNFPSSTREWETIQNYRIIRNCIVHAQGKMYELKEKKDREKLQRFVNKNRNISLVRSEEDLIGFFKKDGEIYIHRGFCEEACNTIEIFLKIVLFPGEAE